MFKVYEADPSTVLLISGLLFVALLAMVVMLGFLFFDKSKKITIGLLISSIVCMSVSLFVGVSASSNEEDYYKENLYSHYKLETIGEAGFHFQNSKIANGEMSDKIYAKFEGDSRVYEIYLMKDDDNNINVYTRNEKGVYLPVSKASIGAKEHNTNFEIVDDQKQTSDEEVEDQENIEEDNDENN